MVNMGLNEEELRCGYWIQGHLDLT